MCTHLDTDPWYMTALYQVGSRYTWGRGWCKSYSSPILCTLRKRTFMHSSNICDVTVLVPWKRKKQTKTKQNKAKQKIAHNVKQDRSIKQDVCSLDNCAVAIEILQIMFTCILCDKNDHVEVGLCYIIPTHSQIYISKRLWYHLKAAVMRFALMYNS